MRVENVHFTHSLCYVGATARFLRQDKWMMMTTTIMTIWISIRIRLNSNVECSCFSVCRLCSLCSFVCTIAHYFLLLLLPLSLAQIPKWTFWKIVVPQLQINAPQKQHNRAPSTLLIKLYRIESMANETHSIPHAHTIGFYKWLGDKCSDRLRFNRGKKECLVFETQIHKSQFIDRNHIIFRIA